MKYAITLIFLALALVAWSAPMDLVPRLFLDWLGADFLLLGIGHARLAHGLFGKRPDGTLPWWSWLLFLPLHGLHALVWHLYRLPRNEPAWHQVTDRLVIGRRLRNSEYSADPPGWGIDEFANYVDLTAEFTEPKALRDLPGYFAFPVLDASAPLPEALHAAVARLRPGKTFVHCAQGHGRAALFSAAVLLSSGQARTVEEAIALITRVRPAVYLNSGQRSCLAKFAAIAQKE
ncbi:MAG TPA: hypothetical protein VK961_16950 [Chthoniobacter sp.]|nr:hypothetical protein [Chthoniobacter sp.]